MARKIVKKSEINKTSKMLDRITIEFMKTRPNECVGWKFEKIKSCLTDMMLHEIFKARGWTI